MPLCNAPIVVSSSSNVPCSTVRGRAVLGDGSSVLSASGTSSIDAAAAIAPTRRKSRLCRLAGKSDMIRLSGVDVLRHERGLESVDQLGLRGVHPLLRGCGIEPPTPIDFGELDPSSGAARPLRAHGVAHDRRRVGIALPRPGVNRLPGLLADAAERDERTVGMDARFFLELAACGVEKILALLDDPLRDGPRAGVAVPPEWAAR